MKKMKFSLCLILMLLIVSPNLYSQLYEANYWKPDVKVNKPHVTKNTKQIVIDNDPQTVQVTSFHNGLAYVNTLKNGSYFIDKSGNRVFDYKAKQHSHIPTFDSSGYAIDCDNNTAIILDKNGKIVKTIPGVQKVTNFVDGVAAITMIRKMNNVVDHINTYINTEGNRFFQSGIEKTTMESLKEARPLCDGLSAFYSYSKQKWGFRDANGKLIHQPIYSDVKDFSEGLAAVCYELKEGGKKWGFIDPEGNWVIDAKFRNEPGSFKNGYARVKDSEGKYFFINKEGKIITKAFDFATDFHNGLAYIRPVGYGLHAMNTDLKNESFIKNGINYYEISGDDLFFIRNNVRSLVSPKGDELLRGVGDNLFSEGLCADKVSSSRTADEEYRVGYYNRDGEFVIEFVESKL